MSDLQLSLLDYQGFSEQGGVYAIININNWKVYIGSTSRFRTRWTDGHIRTLTKGTHHNKHLQSAWNIDKPGAFEFHVLQVMFGCNQEERKVIEQIYVNIHRDHCYNFHLKVETKERSCFSNTPEETRKKRSVSGKKMWENLDYQKRQSEVQSEKMKEYWQNISIEEKEERTASMRAAWDANPELKEIFSERMSNRTVSKETREKISKAVSEINKELWKNDEYRKKVIEGRKRSWANDPERKQRASLRLKEYQKSIAKTYTLLSPTKELITITNISQYCHEHPNLQPSGLCAVANGRWKKYKGWTRP